MLARKAAHEPVRIWSAGCASGQEAYTLAMVFADALGEAAFRECVKVYATDVDDEALAQARLGSYTEKEVESVPPERRKRYFELVNGRYVFRNDLRRAVIFGRHDLVHDAPISRLDLLVCRNTMMYFNAETQGRILGRFHFALNGDGQGNGIIFLGRAEMLLTHGTLFTPLDLKCRVFAKIPPPARPGALAAADAVTNGANHMPENTRLREQALEDAIIARIVLDSNNVLAFTNARARVMFTIHPKDIGRPLQDLEISYRPVEMRSLIEQAFAERRAVTMTSVERRFPGGDTQYLDIVVTPLYEDGQKPLGTSISFVDVTRYARLHDELQRAREEVQTTTEELHSSNEELETTNEELQSSNEELETTNEELQSANEELQTTNEELQSTNEELETMNEELQSTNEELETINDELRDRTNELNQVNEFLETILTSLGLAVTVIDRDQRIQIWNERAEDLWGLRQDEAVDHHLHSLDIGLPTERLVPALRAALGAGARKDVELEAVNRRGRAIVCQITVMPLVSGDGDSEVRGAIVLMDDQPVAETDGRK
jgi:two-component system CheB/CheR fusion protein